MYYSIMLKFLPTVIISMKNLKNCQIFFKTSFKLTCYAFSFFYPFQNKVSYEILINIPGNKTVTVCFLVAIIVSK